MQSKTVLIVDDEPNNLNLLSRYVQREGHVTVLANGGIEALNIISNQDVDLVLLDWMMPDLSGIDVLRAVRETKDASSLPVIMCTALNDNEHVAAALSEGANDFVTKPIDRAVLKARMLSQLQRKAAMSELEIINRDLEKVVAERTKALLGMCGENRVEISAQSRDLIERVLSAIVASPDGAFQALRSDASQALTALRAQSETDIEVAEC